MKIVILFSLIGLIYSYDFCTYSTGDGANGPTVTYDIASISKFRDVQDQFGTNWSVYACPYDTDRVIATVISSSLTGNVEDDPNEAEEEVKEATESHKTLARHVKLDDDNNDNDSGSVQGTRTIVFGLSNMTLWGDSPSGYNKGVEVIFGSLTRCSDTVESSYLKTVIEFVCTQDIEPVYSFEFDECLTTIYVNSSSACPSMDTDTDGSAYNDDDDDDEDDKEDVLTEEVGIQFSSFHLRMSIGFIILMTLSCCVCIRCCIRRRQLKLRAIASRQFSSVAFQPIPSSQITTSASATSVPMYNPYIQPAHYYYYDNNQDGLSAHPQVSLDVDSSDEAVARALQAQFDHENDM